MNTTHPTTEKLKRSIYKWAYVLMAGCVVSSSMLLNGCSPIPVLGVTAAAGPALVKEGGVKGAFNDTSLNFKVDQALRKVDQKVHDALEVTVCEGRVLLTGLLQTDEQHIAAIKSVWQVEGVKEIIDEISVVQQKKRADYARDTWLTTKVKTALLFDGDILSVNYTVKTVDSVVYLIGVAQSEAELKKATEIARKVTGVKQVVSYVRVKDPEEAAREAREAAARAEGAPVVFGGQGPTSPSPSSEILSQDPMTAKATVPSGSGAISVTPLAPDRSF